MVWQTETDENAARCRRLLKNQAAYQPAGRRILRLTVDFDEDDHIGGMLLILSIVAYMLMAFFESLLISCPSF